MISVGEILEALNAGRHPAQAAGFRQPGSRRRGGRTAPGRHL